MILNNKSIKNAVIIVFVLAGIFGTAQAQTTTDETTYTRPSWWFGIAGGANFNFYRGTTQQLTPEVTSQVAFTRGFGVGLNLAPLVEYYRPGSRWGFMFQAGYDGRGGSFKKEYSPCNCPRELSTKLSYITIEPNLRFAPFKSNFYLFGGPRFAFLYENSFTYKQGTNPDYPAQTPIADINGEMSDMNDMIISGQIGAGYDIFLTSNKKRTQFVLSPFVSLHPYFGQEPRSKGTWSVTTVRAGVAFKFGRGKKASEIEKKIVTKPLEPGEVPTSEFSVNAPKNIPVERRVRETFPLRNYVFFDKGETEISDRYVLIRKDQVAEFNENQLEVFKPKKLSGRSDRQMIVYYNVLNIVGSRMQTNPSANITLVGSSENNPAEGRQMAESVKKYLVDVFGIDGARITTTGRDKPKIPSLQPGGVNELDLLAEGDRRVSIESGSTDMLMEFQSGPNAPLKPVEIIATQDAPLDSYVSFMNKGATDAYKSWSLEITDDKGIVQNFGPYTNENVSIPGKSILGTRTEGDFKVVMVGTTKEGKTVKQDTTVHMVLWVPAKNEEGMRYSVIYEFNDATSTAMSRDYLANIVAAKIPAGGTVIIHGHTDIIGDDEYNKKLSLARANDVKSILEKSLAKAGRGDVKFEVYGFGEDTNESPFDNKYPEERFYNRTVVIDIIPAK